MSGAEVPIALAILGTMATTAYQSEQAKNQRQDQRDAIKKQEAAQALAMQALTDQTSQQQKEIVAASDSANLSVAAKKKKTSSASPRGGTLLTSPLGLPGDPNVGQKTLLGQ